MQFLLPRSSKGLALPDFCKRSASGAVRSDKIRQDLTMFSGVILRVTVIALFLTPSLELPVVENETNRQEHPSSLGNSISSPVVDDVVSMIEEAYRGSVGGRGTWHSRPLATPSLVTEHQHDKSNKAGPEPRSLDSAVNLQEQKKGHTKGKKEEDEGEDGGNWAIPLAVGLVVGLAFVILAITLVVRARRNRFEIATTAERLDVKVPRRRSSSPQDLLAHLSSLSKETDPAKRARRPSQGISAWEPRRNSLIGPQQTAGGGRKKSVSFSEPQQPTGKKTAVTSQQPTREQRGEEPGTRPSDEAPPSSYVQNGQTYHEI